MNINNFTSQASTYASNAAVAERYTQQRAEQKPTEDVKKQNVSAEAVQESINETDAVVRLEPAELKSEDFDRGSFVDIQV